MSPLLAIVIAGVLLATLAIIVWLIWRTLKEQAVLRRTMDIQMLQVLLPNDVSREEKREGIGQDIKERIAAAEQWLSTLSNLPTTAWDRLLYGRPIIVLEIVA